MIIQNAVECNVCGDYIFSANRHDFKTCSCGNISVDGGMAYLRRIGNGITNKSYTDRSMEMSETCIDECKTALQWAEDTGRNKLGAVLAVIRALEKNGYINAK